MAGKFLLYLLKGGSKTWEALDNGNSILLMLVNRLNGQRYNVLRHSPNQPWNGSQANDFNLVEIVFIYQRPPMQEIHRTVTSLWAAWKETTSSHVCRGHSCREMGPEIFQIHLQPSLFLAYFSQSISSRRQTRSKKWVEEVQVAKIACVTEGGSPSPSQISSLSNFLFTL